MSEENVLTDESQAKAGKRAAKRLKEQQDNDLRSVLSTPAGRRVFWRLWSEGRVFQSTFHQDPTIAAFQEGNRNLALKFMNHVLEACPERFREAQAEAQRKEKEEPLNA